MLKLPARQAQEDVAVCLLSGGGSRYFHRLLRESHSPTNKASETSQQLRRDRRNELRPQASVPGKGGARGGVSRKALLSLIISDVIDDPLDVIASGPTRTRRLIATRSGARSTI